LGVVAEPDAASRGDLLDCRILGDLEDLGQIIDEQQPDVIVVALSERRRAFPAKEILDCKLQGIRVEDWPTFYEKLSGKILIHNLRPSWLIFADGFARNRLMCIVKRLIDLLFAAFGVCVSLPLMGLVAVLIKLDSSGPILFSQERVGKGGKVFTLRKFRTMVADAEKDTGPVWAQTSDPRVTPLGKILRRTGMDELPQLFNVLKGDMSFVGPRPERPHFVADLERQIPYYRQRLAVQPGITGWAQVRYGYGATLADAIEKLQYDLYYIKNMSVFLDLLTILSTIHKVVFAKVAVQTPAIDVPAGSSLATNVALPSFAEAPTVSVSALGGQEADPALSAFARVDEDTSMVNTHTGK
jgi:sugar transferase (PEP-CTERM system associated)